MRDYSTDDRSRHRRLCPAASGAAYCTCVRDQMSDVDAAQKILDEFDAEAFIAACERAKAACAAGIAACQKAINDINAARRARGEEPL
jgi:hypothetical protein